MYTPPMSSGDQQDILLYSDLILKVARDALHYRLQHERDYQISTSNMDEPLLREQGCFVTLSKNGKLRGCMGTVSAHEPLIQTVAHTACSSAFRDSRFKPLTQKEVDEITISVSILSAPKEIPFKSESELLKLVDPQQDGLILELDSKRGLLLPDAWNDFSQIQDFLNHLKKKTGVGPNQSLEEAKVYKFQTLTVQEER